jgi:hypothetical protein
VFKAQAGHHLAPQPLSSGRNVYDDLGEGFTLLGLDVDTAATDAFARAAADLQVPLTIIADSRAGGRERYDAGLILIRPDQFVAWVSDASPADAMVILRRAVGGG